MAAARAVSWGPVIGASLVTATLAGFLTWRWDLQRIEQRIVEKRAALKKLSVSGGIQPNQQVADYLAARQAAVEQRYQQWQGLVAAPPVPDAAKTDPQLYFQEHFHQVQRSVEQLAAARHLATPELLGFPKELPPSDTVPRLLVQLALIQDMAEIIFGQEVAGLDAVKVEDPETVTEDQGTQPFLIRLPVRVRFTANLAQTMKVLAATHRMTPLIDVRALRIAPAGTPAPTEAPPPPEAKQMAVAPAGTDQLAVELVAARYLVLPAVETTDTSEPSSPAKTPRQKKSTRTPGLKRRGQ